MNLLNHRSRSISAFCWKCCAVLSLILGNSLSSANAQGPIQQVQLPAPNPYYEYLPPGRGWDEYQQTPLDRFLMQTVRQTYGRFDYLHWDISNPGEGVIGGPGKKLLDGEGFNSPSFIDPVRGPGTVFNTQTYPLRSPFLKDYPRPLVLIQTWESNPDELIDIDADGFIYDVVDADADGVNDDDNDIDVFPRITNEGKSEMLVGNNTDIFFSSGDLPGSTLGPAQVAVLAVGQLANSNEFRQNDNNGFRGIWGINTSFGAVETNFFVLNKSRSGFQFQPIPRGLIGTPGAGGVTSVDPMVIPVLVDDQIAPDIFDAAGNTVTDSNNYYLIFNDSYRVTFESETWGVHPSVFWTLNERPDRWRLMSSLGFRYFDFREQMLQVGSFSNDDTVADFTYENEPNTDLVTTMLSTTANQVYGPTAGIRAEVGDERVKFGTDLNIMFGANTHEAVVAVDDVLFVGDDNLTSQSSTHFAMGLEMLVDARIRIMEHVTLSVGYNFLWFNSITRPHDNVYYNIDSTRINAPAPGGPDYTFNNDIIVDKKKTNVNLSGLSLGVMFDW